jgi:DNA-binding NtrC family response regulator
MTATSQLPLFPSFQILLVDDEPAWLRGFSLALERSAGINNILVCQDSNRVMSILEKSSVGLVLLDLTMPDTDGEELLGTISEEYPDIMVIVVSGMNQLETAVRCIRRGAYDYFVKTDALEHITKGVLNAIKSYDLESMHSAMRNRILSGELTDPEVFADIVTISPAMKQIFQYIESIAQSSLPVLVTGESGVGKELIARAVHEASGRTGEMVGINVAGLDDNTFSDTLFGHTVGAFTGATRPRKGMVERSNGGTLFLDEIGDLSLQSQVKLLRLLQEGEYYPLGSDRPRCLQARIIVATHQDLRQKERQGEFRRDLYYRLQIHHMHIPPLRERKEDIPLLLDRFLGEAARELGKKVPQYPKELSGYLTNYAFPGNIRELKAMVYDAVSVHKSHTMSMSSFLKAMHLEPSSDQMTEKRPHEESSPFDEMPSLPTIAQCVEQLVAEAMKKANGNQTLAARMLGISQPALSKRLKNMQAKD